MADEKISAMPSATTLAGTELIAGVQGGVNVNITPSQIKTFVGGGGAVTSVNVVSPLVGGNITTAGNVALPVATDGQLLIGNTTSGLLQVGSIVAGSNVTITPGHGNITISSTASGNTTGTPGGTSGQVQWNSAGNFAGITEGSTGAALISQGNGTSALMLKGATLQVSPVNPTGPANVGTVTMQGIGNVSTITPLRTGTVMVTVSASANTGGVANAAGDGLSLQLYYNSGAAPANGAAVTGTAVGNARQVALAATATGGPSYSGVPLNAIITGMTVGTAYWIDIGASSLGHTGGNLHVISVSAMEQ